MLPFFGVEVLDMARDVAAFNLPARVGQLFGVSFWRAPAALAPQPDFDDLPGKGLPCVEPGWPRK